MPAIYRGIIKEYPLKIRVGQGFDVGSTHVDLVLHQLVDVLDVASAEFLPAVFSTSTDAMALPPKGP